MSTNAKKQTHMHAEGPDVGTGLAADPENTKVTIVVELDELALVDATDTQLPLDSRNQRRALEKSTSQGLEGLGKGCLASRDLIVETNNGNVFFTGSLL